MTSSSTGNTNTKTDTNTNASSRPNLAKKISSLLGAKSHDASSNIVFEHEKFLASSILLLRTNPTSIIQVLDSHPSLYEFVLQLAETPTHATHEQTLLPGRSPRSSLQFENTLARLGVRLLCLYYNDSSHAKCKIPIDNSSLKKIMKYFNWRQKILQKSCAEDSGDAHLKLEWLDVELLQLFTLILKSTIPSSTAAYDRKGQQTNNSDVPIPDPIVKDISVFTSCVSPIPVLLVEGLLGGKIILLRRNLNSEHGGIDGDRGTHDQNIPKEQDQDGEGTRLEQNDRILMELIETLLGPELSSGNDMNPKDIVENTLESAYIQSFAQFMAMYASFIQNHGNVKLSLESTFVVSTIDLLLGRTNTKLSTNMSAGVGGGRTSKVESCVHVPKDSRTLIHYALLSIISWHLASREEQEQRDSERTNKFDLAKEILKSPTGTLSIGFQKFILLGLSSMVDASSRGPESKDKKFMSNPDSNMDIESMIRTMTVNIVATLIDDIGIEWMILPGSSSSAKDGTSCGVASTFCNIVNLIAGEQRIVLGRLLDAALSFKDPDVNLHLHTASSVTKDVQLISGPQVEAWLEISQGCTQIGLSTLQRMIDLASANENENETIDDVGNHQKMFFNIDAILHLRRSLEDLLNSCVQFLLEDTSSRDFGMWGDCKYSCVRYLGAYLSSVDLFDYDKGDDEDKNDDESDNGIGNCKDPHTETRTTSTITLLRAIRNGIDVCHNIDESSPSSTNSQTMYNSSPKVISIFPCIVAALACCEDGRQISILRKYLLEDTALSNAIETLLASSYTSIVEHGVVPTESISWGCAMIDSLLEYQSLARTKGAMGSTFVMNTKKVTRHLWSIMKILMEKIQLQQQSSRRSKHESTNMHDNNRFSDLLDQAFHCFMALCEVDGSFMNELDTGEMRLLAFLGDK